MGRRSNLHIASELTAAGVLAADTEGVVNSRVPRRRRLRLDRDSYHALCQQVLQRDGWRCQRCGSSQDLQVHHIQPRILLGGDVEEDLITVCTASHRKIHLRAEALAWFDL